MPRSNETSRFAVVTAKPVRAGGAVVMSVIRIDPPNVPDPLERAEPPVHRGRDCVEGRERVARLAHADQELARSVTSNPTLPEISRPSGLLVMSWPSAGS